MKGNFSFLKRKVSLHTSFLKKTYSPFIFLQTRIMKGEGMIIRNHKKNEPHIPAKNCLELKLNSEPWCGGKGIPDK